MNMNITNSILQLHLPGANESMLKSSLVNVNSRLSGEGMERGVAILTSEPRAQTPNNSASPVFSTCENAWTHDNYVN